jgi:hypothetical protein
MTPDDRGQVVLLVAVVVAVALVTMSTAYHGLGYRGDVRSTEAIGTDDPMTTAERQLQRGVDTAAVGPTQPWSERNETINHTRETLATATGTLQRNGVARENVYRVTENPDVAAAWADEDCPGGEMRVFGPCLADGGVVVQERANETVLVGVAVDVTVRRSGRETTASFRLTAR